MKRGAAVVYPQDAAQIVASADVFPDARVLVTTLKRPIINTRDEPYFIERPRQEG